MEWGFIGTVFFLSTFKFMFAPFTGSGLGLPFWETYIASVAGGTFGSALFYFASEFFISYAHRKRAEKERVASEQGIELKKKKKFSRTNRLIIKLKHKLGIYGLCFWGPFFLSVPVGSIIVAKFYGKLKKTFPLIILGMAINAFITSALAYLHVLL
jgi:hypothetical protein